MESRYKRGILRALDIAGNMLGIIICLIWLGISNNKLVDYFREKERRHPRKGFELHLDEIAIPEVGRKYLKSCR